MCVFVLATASAVEEVFECVCGGIAVTEHGVVVIGIVLCEGNCLCFSGVVLLLAGYRNEVHSWFIGREDNGVFRKLFVTNGQRWGFLLFEDDGGVMRGVDVHMHLLDDIAHPFTFDCGYL